MADTQWPRYYVFEQPEEGAAFSYAGSVHAPDAEMALLIARDTFARRPRRTAMWLVRDIRIFSLTREQLDAAPQGGDGAGVGGEGAAGGDPGGGENGGGGERSESPVRYHVFSKRTQKGVHIHSGEMEAATPEEAIRRADAEQGGGKFPVWWAIAEKDLVRSPEEDREVLYDSSPGKSFRHESEYPVVTMMMELRRKKKT